MFAEFPRFDICHNSEHVFVKSMLRSHCPDLQAPRSRTFPKSSYRLLDAFNPDILISRILLPPVSLQMWTLNQALILSARYITIGA